MVAGQLGAHGQHAQFHVGEVPRNVSEHAAIQYLEVVVKSVLENSSKGNLAPLYAQVCLYSMCLAFEQMTLTHLL